MAESTLAPLIVERPTPGLFRVRKLFNMWLAFYIEKREERWTVVQRHNWMMDPCLRWDEFERVMFWQRMSRCPFCHRSLMDNGRPLYECCHDFYALIQPHTPRVCMPSSFSFFHSNKVYVHYPEEYGPPEYWIHVLKCIGCGRPFSRGEMPRRQCCRHYAGLR